MRRGRLWVNGVKWVSDGEREELRAEGILQERRAEKNNGSRKKKAAFPLIKRD